jgi:hypothetical protein
VSEPNITATKIERPRPLTQPGKRDRADTFKIAKADIPALHE